MPSIEEQIKEAAEVLKKQQKQQFEEFEPQIKKAIEAGEGVAEMTEKFEGINGKVSETIDKITELTKAQAEEKKALTERLDEFESKYGAPDVGGTKAGPDLGRRFIKSVGGENPEEAFEQAYNDGKTGKHKLKAGEFIGARKDISGASGSAADLQDSLRIPGVVQEPNTQLTVQDLIPQMRVSNRTVDWVRENVLTNAAAPHAENETISGATAKPKSNITFTPVSETMSTIATWIAASKQILRYSNRTQLRTYIDTRLRFMVMLELEDQILLGDGTGENLNGLVPQATDFDRGYAQIQGADPTKIDTLRRSITQARLAEYPVTGMVLHPTDVEDITLTKGSDLHYIWAMPGQANTLRPWGVALAESTRMTEDEFLTGAFSLGAELFIGEDLTVEATRYHDDFFTKNLVAILAEMDALLAVYRPKAFVTGSFVVPT